MEQDDHVEVNGVVFNKPFVEKPVSAEDHNIYVYYPSSGVNILLKIENYPTPHTSWKKSFSSQKNRAKSNSIKNCTYWTSRFEF